MKCKLYLTGRLALLVLTMFAGMTLSAQSRTVQGTVTDAAGQPLIGVSVTVKGTTTGATTDAAGKYSLRVPNDQSVLSFDYLGYVTQEIIVGDKTTVDVRMVEDAQTLDEVVVIGYGTVRKRDLTGSVASVGGEEIAAMPIANAAQALQGRIAGVSITTVDGRPDAGMKIRVRGGGSITQSNEPLYVVDGFPVDNINDIPASQIESINILKDASSTAIYGARGANGVVLVTTKNPSSERFTVSYDGYFQIKTLANKVDVMGGADYVKYNWELYDLSSGKDEATYRQAFALGAPGTAKFKEGLDAYNDVESIDWLDEIYGGPTYAWSHNVNVSGGNDRTKFTVSYNSLNDDALRMDSWYKRENITAKLNAKLLNNLTIDVDARFSDARIYGSSSSTNSAIYHAPVEPLGDYSTDLNPGFVMESDNVNPEYAPDKLIHDSYNMRYRKNFRINASLTWEIIKGLTFKSEYGKSFSWIKTYEYSGTLINRGTKQPSASIGRNEYSSMRFVNTLNWQVQGLGDQHRLDVLLGQELNSSDKEESKMKVNRLPSTFDFQKAFGMINQWDKSVDASDIISNTFGVPSRMASFFGRVNYTFRDRYILTGTLRADGSSNFHKDNRWGYFPAAAAAWRISGEPFMQNARWIDNLKLRVSYGQAGNDRIDADLWRIIWKASAGGYSFNNVRQSYYEYASSQLPNPNLKWETTITRNLGLDFSLFNNRLYGTVEGYWNTTKDLLISSEIPAYLGFSTQQQNIGQTRNIGLEVSLGGDIVRKKDFTLSANFNIGFNKNKIEKLADGMPFKQFASAWGSTTITPYSDYQFEVGQSAGLILGYITDGFYTVDDFDFNPVTKQYTLKGDVPNSVLRYQLPIGVSGDASAAYPGALKLKKIANDGVKDITTEDITVIGNTNPKHIGGLNINAVWKNFDLMLAFNWSYGNDIYNANKLDAASMTQNKVNVNLMAEMKNRFRLYDDLGNRVVEPEALKELNKNATIWYPYQNTRVVHSWGIEDGSFLRLNNVTLGYTLPKKLTEKVSISKLRVYATVYNAWTWTGYSGVDPEVDGKSSNLLTPGLDWDAYPRARTFTFGLNVTF